MPVCLLTLHAYATWMPDRREGSVHWRRGEQPADAELADAYRRRQRQTSVCFDHEKQRVLIDQWLEAAEHQELIAYAAATDPTHLHLLVGWRGGREPEVLQRSVKRSLSVRMNREFGERTWFTRGGHRRRVRERGHFDHLVRVYLPGHVGWKWDRVNGLYR